MKIIEKYSISLIVLFFVIQFSTMSGCRKIDKLHKEIILHNGDKIHVYFRHSENRGFIIRDVFSIGGGGYGPAGIFKQKYTVINNWVLLNI